MAYQNGKFILFYFLIDSILPVFGDGDDKNGSGLSTGVIVVIVIIGAMFVFFPLILCFHHFCIKPQHTVKPHRIGVMGVGHRSLHPSNVLTSTNTRSPPARPCPIDPPPYHLHDDGFRLEPPNRNELRNPSGRQQLPPIVHPTTTSRFEGDPVQLLPHGRNFEVHEHCHQVPLRHM